jgi:hypothetical protein
VLKKPSRNSDAVDVRADDPEHTMDKFTEGLRRVLTTKKSVFSSQKGEASTSRVLSVKRKRRNRA